MKKILFLLFVLPLVACGASTEQVDQESTQQELASISIENQKNEILLDEIVNPDSEKAKPIKKESVFLSDYKTYKNIDEKIKLEKINAAQTLDQPWGMDFIDSNTLIITEKKGNLILFDLNKKISKDIRKKFNKFNFFKMNFKDLEQIEEDYLKNKYDFILLDLGFSSNQLEDAQVGISFKVDSKLNMNYLNSGFTAYEIVNNYSEEELSRVFADYGEIKQSLKLAKFIVRTRQDKAINTNFDLIEVLRDSGVNFRSKKIHFATQAFQALRIECNKELENLNIFFEKIYNYLNKDGILAIISFHSLEDRIVKNYFKFNSFKKDNFKQ